MLIEIVTRGVGEPAGGHRQAWGASGGARTPQGDYFGSGRFCFGLLSTPVSRYELPLSLATLVGRLLAFWGPVWGGLG